MFPPPSLFQVYEELERKCVRGGEKKLKPEYVSP